MEFLCEKDGNFSYFDLTSEEFTELEDAYENDPKLMRALLLTFELTDHRIVQLTAKNPQLQNGHFFRIKQENIRYKFDKVTNKYVMENKVGKSVLFANALREGNTIRDALVEIPTGYAERDENNPEDEGPEDPVVSEENIYETNFYGENLSDSNQVVTCPEIDVVTRPVDLPSTSRNSNAATKRPGKKRPSTDLASTIHLDVSSSDDDDGSEDKFTWTKAAIKYLLVSVKEYRDNRDGKNIILKQMYVALAKKLIDNGFFQALTSGQVEHKYRGLVKKFKIHVDDQNKTGQSKKKLELETEMYDCFGDKDDIRPMALLASKGGLKRPRGDEDIDDDEIEFLSRKKVKLQKSKQAPLVQVMIDMKDEKTRIEHDRTHAYNERTKALKEGFSILADAIKHTRS